MGAGLVAMVARLTIGKKKYAQVESQMASVLQQAEQLRAALTQAIQEDTAAFEAVMAAFKLPKDSPEQSVARQQAVDSATLTAARVPLEVARKALRVLQLAVQVVSTGNLNAISDGASGAALARAALASAGYNVRINVASLSGNPQGQPLLAELKEIEGKATLLEAQIAGLMVERGNLSF
jgi:glutamate formiminotransferase/formiminotetrahydrofolate cyclodeaminase